MFASCLSAYQRGEPVGTVMITKYEVTASKTGNVATELSDQERKLEQEGVEEDLEGSCTTIVKQGPR